MRKTFKAGSGLKVVLMTSLLAISADAAVAAQPKARLTVTPITTPPKPAPKPSLAPKQAPVLGNVPQSSLVGRGNNIISTDGNSMRGNQNSLISPGNRNGIISQDGGSLTRNNGAGMRRP